jgi:hypothetical protein
MPKTSTARANQFICPLCGERLAEDDEGRGFVRHLAPPRGPQIFDDTDKINRMLRDGDLDPDYMGYFDKTVRCPFQQGQRDG